MSGPWLMSEGEYEGKPIVVRLNAGLAPLAASGTYPFQAGIAVRLNAPDERGFPSAEDSAALGRFEDEFVEALCGDTSVVFAAVLTTGGMREFVFYASDEALLRERFRAWAATPKSHRVQLMVRRDPRWATYRALT